MAITRWAVDRHPAVHEALANVIDIIDTVSEVTKIAAFAVTGFIPIMREFNLSAFIAGRGKENQRKPPCFTVKAAEFCEADQLKKSDGRRGIADADHGVKIFHTVPIADSKAQGQPSIGIVMPPLLCLHRYRETV